MSNTLGDGPIESKYRSDMNRLAKLLDNFFNEPGKPKQTGFCLMLFDFGEGAGRCNYISNADRRDVVTLMKEQIARFEGQPELKGHA